MTLYEMKEAANNLYRLMEQEEIDEQTFRDTLEAIGADDKVESYCQVIKQLEADKETEVIARINVLQTEIDRLKAVAEQYDNKVTKMKGALGEFIEACGGEKQKGKTFTVWLQSTESLRLDADAAVPDEYCKHELKVDRAAVKKALQEGKVISGARLDVTRGVRIR